MIGFCNYLAFSLFLLTIIKDGAIRKVHIYVAFLIYIHVFSDFFYEGCAA